MTKFLSTKTNRYNWKIVCENIISCVKVYKFKNISFFYVSDSNFLRVYVWNEQNNMGSSKRSETNLNQTKYHKNYRRFSIQGFENEKKKEYLIGPKRIYIINFQVKILKNHVSQLENFNFSTFKI